MDLPPYEADPLIFPLDNVNSTQLLPSHLLGQKGSTTISLCIGCTFDNSSKKGDHRFSIVSYIIVGCYYCCGGLVLERYTNLKLRLL